MDSVQPPKEENKKWQVILNNVISVTIRWIQILPILFLNTMITLVGILKYFQCEDVWKKSQHVPPLPSIGLFPCILAVNIMGFRGCVVPVGTTQLCLSRMKLAIDNTQMNGPGCLPRKPYLQKQVAGHVLLLTSAVVPCLGFRCCIHHSLVAENRIYSSWFKQKGMC